MDGAFDWGDETRPEHTNDIVIYELHVKGFTQSATSGVPDEKRGESHSHRDRLRDHRQAGAQRWQNSVVIPIGQGIRAKSPSD